MQDGCVGPRHLYVWDVLVCGIYHFYPDMDGYGDLVAGEQELVDGSHPIAEVQAPCCPALLSSFYFCPRWLHGSPDPLVSIPFHPLCSDFHRRHQSGPPLRRASIDVCVWTVEDEPTFT